MTFPRLTVDLDVVTAATCRVASELRSRGVSLCGVTKSLDGEPELGRTMLDAGAAGLADSRLPALARLAGAGLRPLTLIRAPQPDELGEAALIADRVLLGDPGTAAALGRLRDGGSRHAGPPDREPRAPALRGRVPVGGAQSGDPIRILLTVDLGDRREGVLPDAAPAVATKVAGLPGVSLAGVAVNFACLSGQLPSQALFRQAEDVLAAVADHCADEPLLSLGGTCVLPYLHGYSPRFATEVRAGGGLIYGHDFVGQDDLAGLRRSDPLLHAVVLECHRKPPAPQAPSGRDAFGHEPEVRLPDDDDAWYALLALGRRDMEPAGLRPLLPGAHLVGASSDVTVLCTQEQLRPGDVVRFAVGYDALVRAVTSPSVAVDLVRGSRHERTGGDGRDA